MNVSVLTAHSSATDVATIQCEDLTVDIGDEIQIDMGYEGDFAEVFTGYIKSIARKTPEDLYTVTAYDTLIQAIDYFIVSTDPEHPYNFGLGVTAESLVTQILALAGLTLTGFDVTSFSFGVHNPVEVNLISAYDYCKMIGDIVTWSLWADHSGNIYFKNRKPYVMTGASGQIGDDTDERPVFGAVGSVSLGKIDDTQILDFSYVTSEKELRNRVVVYGEGGVKSIRDKADSYDPRIPGYIQILPINFYKAVVASYSFIGSQVIADQTAEYNLLLLNRLTERISMTMVGSTRYTARNIMTLDESITGVTGNWYIYSSELNWSKAGFINNLELRR